MFSRKILYSDHEEWKFIFPVKELIYKNTIFYSDFKVKKKRHVFVSSYDKRNDNGINIANLQSIYKHHKTTKNYQNAFRIP